LHGNGGAHWLVAVAAVKPEITNNSGGGDNGGGGGGGGGSNKSGGGGSSYKKTNDRACAPKNYSNKAALNAW